MTVLPERIIQYMQRWFTHLYNSIHGTRLLTEATVDAFGHVNVITGRPPAAVSACLCFYGDSLDKDSEGCRMERNVSRCRAGLLHNICESTLYTFTFIIFVFSIYNQIQQADWIDSVLKCPFDCT